MLLLQGVYINQIIMINSTQYVISTLSEKIIDNPRLTFYQTVYAVALILLLIMAYLTAHSYMAVSQLLVYEQIFSVQGFVILLFVADYIK